MSSNDLREAGENYLEAILRLENENGEARSIDVARMLGVSRPSVNKAVGILKDMNYVEQEHYGAIKLTESGRKMALRVEKRHTVIKKFLISVLGVDSATADEDACRMEHVVSSETMQKLADYLEDVTKI